MDGRADLYEGQTDKTMSSLLKWHISVVLETSVVLMEQVWTEFIGH